MIWKLLGLLLFCLTNVCSGYWPSDVAEQLSDGDSYDYIVVGSGSAGSPIAARLAESGQDVLLLEAGGEPTLSTVIPGLALSNLLSDRDWNYTSEYDYRTCQSLLDRRCHKSRGKVLGGCSAINFMIYMRGNKVDYDDWDIPSWTYDKMLPYFLRMESLTDYDNLSPELKQYHNNNGPLKVSLVNESTPWRDHLINAFQEIGFTRNWDVNGPSQIGVTITHATIFAGERQSAAVAYLVPNSNNNNLNVAYNSYVTKVIIDDCKIAKGVRVSIAGKKEIMITANKEVILSAGTINTPHLLMLSGIGPKSELEIYGIHVNVDNPHVGQRLQDHPTTPIILTANTGTAIPFSEDVLKAALDQWLNDRTGLLATTSTIDISAFIDTVHGSSVPDVQFVHTFLPRNDTVGARTSLAKVLMFNNAIYKDVLKLNKDSEIITALPILIHPKSRGSIHLASGNPYDYPLIYGNTLVEPEDYDTYLRAIRLIEKLLTTETFRNNNVNIPRIDSLKECNALEFQSDDYWLCYRDNLGDTLHHPVGTASIGRVVDERLRVLGIRKLRVADASVMPFITRGNPNAPTIAIGERAADFIAEDNGF